MSRSTAQIRCEWGEHAVRAVGPEADVIVIVDVLSFSTSVDVAVSRGARVLPYRPGAPDAESFARERRAHLATSRGMGRFSLSPVSLLGLGAGESVVLPSPNGAMATLAAGGGRVLAGCLRNASAIARRCAEEHRVLVVPAGERWPDGSLRPSLEDWLGAGAILDRLTGVRSDEAHAAVAAFRELRTRLRTALRDCASGRELIDRGYAEDVEVAADLDASPAVPWFDGEAFSGREIPPREELA